jgi:hypothetical protein
VENQGPGGCLVRLLWSLGNRLPTLAVAWESPKVGTTACPSHVPDLINGSEFLSRVSSESKLILFSALAVCNRQGKHQREPFVWFTGMLTFWGYVSFRGCCDKIIMNLVALNSGRLFSHSSGGRSPRSVSLSWNWGASRVGKDNGHLCCLQLLEAASILWLVAAFLWSLCL